jgi:hypothetical protein
VAAAGVVSAFIFWPLLPLLLLKRVLCTFFGLFKKKT